MKGGGDEAGRMPHGRIGHAREQLRFVSYPWSQTHLFDRQRYLDMLATFSDHATLYAVFRPRIIGR